MQIATSAARSPVGSVTPRRHARERCHIVEFDGVRLHVSERGPVGQRPLVLVMGLGATHALWDPLRSALGEDVTTTAFDNPGVGQSPTPRLPYRVTKSARIVLAMLDELGHDEVDLMGCSLGGVVAQEIARQAPNRVCRLILAATTPGWGGVPGTWQAARALSTPRRYYDRQYLYRVSPTLYGGRLRAQPELMHQQVHARLSRPPTVLGYYLQLLSVYGWSSLPWLHRITMPTLVLAGDDDPVTPVGNARILARCIPRAQLEVLPGGGHLFVVDSPEEVAPKVSAFLRDTL